MVMERSQQISSSAMHYRPCYERPFLLLIAGFTMKDAWVPVIKKRPVEEFTSNI